jgi:thiol-disulfide isomerase/thioredoxin
VPQEIAHGLDPHAREDDVRLFAFVPEAGSTGGELAVHVKDRGVERERRGRAGQFREGFYHPGVTSRRLTALLAGLALLASCDGQPRPKPPAGTIPAQNVVEAPLLPAFADALPAMDPRSFQRLLAQLRGTPVLVNFWGSWCPPCREEMPRLVAAHREFGDRVQFLGVDILDSRAEAKRFMDEFEMAFPSVFDPPDAIKTDLGHFGQPVTAFYRANGSLSFVWTGPIGEDDLHRQLEEIAG